MPRLKPIVTPIFDEIRASDLIQWAGRSESAQWLPSLVRQLVLASGAKLRSCRFYTQEESARSGWDGIVDAESPGFNVPAGTSAWEISKQAAAKGKASKDATKRARNPGEVKPEETTLVHVTLRVWPKKKVGRKVISSGEHKRSAEKEQKDSGWKDVRILDAEDLTAAIARSPAVSIWLASVMGRNVVGAFSLSSQWSRLATLLKGLAPDVFLAGRAHFVQALETWIAGPPRVFEIHTWSPDDLRDAMAAWHEHRTRMNGITGLLPIAVTEPGAWRYLIHTPAPLLLLIDDGLTVTAEELSAATDKGHYVLLGTTAAPGPDGGCTLGPLERDQLSDALRLSGVDYRRTWKVATDAGVSGVALKRLLSGRGPVPPWAKGAMAPKLAPVALLSAWNGKIPGDRERVSAVFDLSYPKVEALLSPWADTNDPLVRRVGEQWRLVGPEDAWRWLAPHLKAVHCARFADNATVVLTELNPRYDLRPKDRLLANVRGAVPQHSRECQQAMAQGLCLMSLRPPPESVGEGMPGLVHAVLTNVFAGASNWRLWASLGYTLVYLAEAEPRIFLKAAESGLRPPNHALGALFGQSGDGIFGDNLHVNILWALQGLCWERESVVRSLKVVAALARLDPGGNTGPRPLGVLRDAFTPWSPQCCLDVKDRCQALDRIAEAEPEVGWKLLCALLPKLRDSLSPAHRPIYRKVAPPTEKVPVAEYWAVVRHVAKELIKAAGTVVERWETLIRQIHLLPQDIFDLIVEEVRRLGATLGEEEHTALWDVLRQEVTRHQYFPKAQWTMRPARLSQLAALVAELEPVDPVLRFAWLFQRMSLDLPGTTMDTPREEQLRLREEARVSALRKILAAGGVENLIRFALRVKDANEMGFLVAKYALWQGDGTIFPKWLEESREPLVGFAYGYASAKFSALGWTWLEALQPGTWNPAAFSILSTLFPFARDTWNRTDRLGVAWSEAYWKRAHPWLRDSSPADVAYAADKFLSVSRADVALQCVYDALQARAALPADLVLKVLEGAEAREAHHREPADAARRPAAQHEAHLIAETVKALHTNKDLTPEEAHRLEKLEWFYLPILESYGSPKYLIERIRKEPAFFIELLSLVYFPEKQMSGPMPERTPEEKQRFDNAYQLLDSVHRLPGATDSGLNEADFRAWVKASRELAVKAGLLRACDNQIGQLLIFSPVDPTGSWPCAPVCRLLTDDSSKELEEAFRIGLFNNQGRPGIMDRSFEMDNTQARADAVAKLREYAAKLDIDFPMVAGILREVADDQERSSKVISRLFP